MSKESSSTYNQEAQRQLQEQKARKEGIFDCLVQVVEHIPDERRGQAVEKYRQWYSRYQDQTPIEFTDIPENPLNYKYELNAEIESKISQAVEITKQRQREVGIVISGVFDGEKINFNHASDLIMGQQQEVDFNANNAEGISYLHAEFNLLKNNLATNNNSAAAESEGVICLIHTHPQVGQFADNFSISDLYSVKDANKQTNDLTSGNDKKISLMGIVVTPKESGQYRKTAVMYDSESKNGGFYRLNPAAKERRPVPGMPLGVIDVPNVGQYEFTITPTADKLVVQEPSGVVIDVAWVVEENGAKEIKQNDIPLMLQRFPEEEFDKILDSFLREAGV